jgi:prepilin peptidase CpaA
MTPVQFFPNPAFGWVFVAVLLGGLAVAAYTDLKTLKVPKFVTVGLLVAGFLFSLVRGGLNADAGRLTWLFPEADLATGVADGALFSVVGMLSAFAIYFSLWILGVAGGGDVKITTAVGAWLGWKYVLGALLLSYPFVVVFVIFSFIVGYSKKVAPVEGGTKFRKRKMSYSLPLACAVAVLLIGGFRYDLGLATPPAPAPTAAP